MLLEVILSLFLWVSTWLIHSMDCIDGIGKLGVRFCDDITATYNIPTEPHQQHTLKLTKGSLACIQHESHYSITYTTEKSPADKA
jgi:hypothetical protein